MCVYAKLAAFRPLVISNRGIVRSERVDILDFLRPHFGIRNDLASDSEVSPLLGREISFQRFTIGRSEVPESASEIHPDVNLSIRVRDLIDELHSNRPSERIVAIKPSNT